jgi:hypothetical protein
MPLGGVSCPQASCTAEAVSRWNLPALKLSGRLLLADIKHLLSRLYPYSLHGCEAQLLNLRVELVLA